LLHLLGRLEEVLLALAAFEADDPPPAVGLGPDALDAVRHAWSAIDHAERAPTSQPVASDGRFELVPVRFVELQEVDLARIAQVVTILRLALLPAGDELVADALRAIAGYKPEKPGALVADFARSHALLDLDDDDDTRLLQERLAGETGRVVLTVAEEAPTGGSLSGSSRRSTSLIRSAGSCTGGVNRKPVAAGAMGGRRGCRLHLGGVGATNMTNMLALVVEATAVIAAIAADDLPRGGVVPSGDAPLAVDLDPLGRLQTGVGVVSHALHGARSRNPPGGGQPSGGASAPPHPPAFPGAHANPRSRSGCRRSE